MADAEAHGRVLVTDTAGADYGPIQIDILQGYRILAEEIVAGLPAGQRPSHVFVQGGVGGLAAGVLAHLWFRYGAARPRFVVVEPENANALMASAEAGAPAEISASLETMMGCLAAAGVHHVAWEILAECADDFLAVGRVGVAANHADLAALGAWIDANVVDRFGPVRQMKQGLVVRFSYRGFKVARRRKAGVELREPEFVDVRWDDTIDQVARLQDLAN